MAWHRDAWQQHGNLMMISLHTYADFMPWYHIADIIMDNDILAISWQYHNDIMVLLWSYETLKQDTKRYRISCSKTNKARDSSTKGWIQNEFPSENWRSEDVSTDTLYADILQHGEMAKAEISKKVEEILRKYMIDAHQSEPYQQQQNPVERSIQDI